MDACLIESSGRKLQESFQKTTSACLNSNKSNRLKNKKGKKKQKSSTTWYDDECKEFKDKIGVSPKPRNNLPRSLERNRSCY